MKDHKSISGFYSSCPHATCIEWDTPVLFFHVDPLCLAQLAARFLRPKLGLTESPQLRPLRTKSETKLKESIQKWVMCLYVNKFAGTDMMMEIDWSLVSTVFDNCQMAQQIHTHYATKDFSVFSAMNS